MNHDLFLAVLRCNSGKCVACGMSAEQVDHIKPRHAGGSDEPENLAPLCTECNKVKSCFWPRHGYHPWPGFDDRMRARQILDAEIEFSLQIYGPSWLEVDVTPVLCIVSRPIHLPRPWHAEAHFTPTRTSALYPDQAKDANWTVRAAPPSKPVKLSDGRPPIRGIGRRELRAVRNTEADFKAWLASLRA